MDPFYDYGLGELPQLDTDVVRVFTLQQGQEDHQF